MNYTTLVEYILILGAVQGIFLSVILFTKKENPVANKLLASAILAYAIDIINTLFVYNGFYEANPYYMGMLAGMPFMYAPSIYLYSKTIGRNSAAFDKRNLLHFIPFFLFQIVGIILFLFLFDIDYKESLLHSDGTRPLEVLIMGAIIPIYGITYILLSLHVSRKFNKRIRDSFSNIEKIKLDWLFYLLIGLSFIWILEIVQYIATEGLTETNITLYVSIYIFVSIFIYSIAFKALRQPEIFLTLFEENSEKLQEPDIQYAKSGLSKEKANEIITRLENIMKENKPYLNPDLNASSLAEMLSISSHNLSQALNSHLNQTFYDYINSYRVEEVKKNIADDMEMKFTLLNHAYDAGFSSKSSFNNAFKKITGKTPSEYREGLGNR